MSSRANVHSLEAIEAVRAALVSFFDQVEHALATLDVEMRRMLDWLEHDRPAYWKRQTRQAIDGVNDARAALHRCLMFPIADERPACREERAALKKAQARLAYCEQKSEQIRHWTRTVRRELFEYEGRISQLVQLAEIDGPHAVGVLDRILRHIEEYQTVRTSDRTAAYRALANDDELWRKPSSETGARPTVSRPTATADEHGPSDADDVVEGGGADAHASPTDGAAADSPPDGQRG